MGEAAVQGGILKHFSVSQLKAFLACERYWAAEKLFGFPRGGTRATTGGHNAHKEAENYYKGGGVPSNLAFQRAILDKVLPSPQPSVFYVERAIEELEPKLYVEDVAFHGFMDLVVPPDALGETPPAVWDWKHSGTFQYAADPAEDLQMLLYGYWALQRWPEWDEVDLALVYFNSRGSEAYQFGRNGPREPARVPRARVEREWRDVVVPTVRRMKALVAVRPGRLKEVPDSRGPACEAYGGCAFRNRCWPMADRLDRIEPRSAA